MKALLVVTLLIAIRSLFGQPTVYGNQPYMPLPPGTAVVPIAPLTPRNYVATGKFLNFSCRVQIGVSNPSFTTGIFISEGSRVLLVRAVGPTLRSLGLSGTLARPRLEVIDAKGVTVATAVPWSTTDPLVQSTLRTSARDVGAFPLDEGSADEALLLFLPTGAYSCVVSGLDSGEGVVLLEVYEVPGARVLTPVNPNP